MDELLRFNRRPMRDIILQTDATRRHFHLIKAWYGVIPSFEHLANKNFNYSCIWRMSQWMNDMTPAYAMAADFAGESMQEMTKRNMAEMIACQKIRMLDLESRPRAMQSFFRENFQPNDVWQYRNVPTGL